MQYTCNLVHLMIYNDVLQQKGTGNLYSISQEVKKQKKTATSSCLHSKMVEPLCFSSLTNQGAALEQLCPITERKGHIFYNFNKEGFCQKQF